MYWLCKLSLQNSFRNSFKVSNSLDLDQVEKKLFGLIWTQTVCKGNQQMTNVSKVFYMSMKVLCIGSHYMLKLCLNVKPSEYDQKSTFIDYKPECASVITSLNACNGYFL